MTAADERLAACKAYMKVDYDEDDALIAALLDAAGEYLAGAGCARERAPALYDLVLHAMVLAMYDGRMDGAQTAAEGVPARVRAMMNQLKLRCNYGGADDGGTGG